MNYHRLVGLIWVVFVYCVWFTLKKLKHWRYSLVVMLVILASLLLFKETQISVTVWLGLELSVKAYAAFISSTALLIIALAGVFLHVALIENFTLNFQADCNLLKPIGDSFLLRASLVPLMISCGFPLFHTIVTLAILRAGLGCYSIFLEQKASNQEAAFVTVGLFIRECYSVYSYMITGSAYPLVIVEFVSKLVTTPGFDFFEETSNLYSYRYLLVLTYLAGMVAFIWLFPLIMNPSLFKGWPLDYYHSLNET